jgi:hypothetical protein
MKQLRQRLSYANVMSSLAVFLVLGGGAAFAANQLGKNSVGAKQLKRNAVTAAKIKKNAVTRAKIRNDAITGAKVKAGSLNASDIDVATLPTVPSATTAGSASSAANANAVSGQSVHKLSKLLTEGQADVVVASVAGFTLTATCRPNNTDVLISGPTDAGFVVQAGGIYTDKVDRTTGGYRTSAAGEGGGIRIDAYTEKDLGDSDFGISSVVGATGTGTTLSGVVGYDWDSFKNSPPNTCLVYGHLITG